MKRILQSLIVFLLLGVCTEMSAQDIHFSQFYMSPLNLNPAMTGVNNCKTRLIANYRNQWASALQANAYNTYSVSYDQKLPVGRSDYFGIGGVLWGDVAGETRFGTTQARITFSYSKKVGGYRKSAKYLVFGAEAGLAQRRISPNDLRWPSQQTGGVYDPDATGANNEALLISDYDFLFADLGAGLLWFNVMDDYNNWYLGAAIAHLNQANVSFYEATQNGINEGANLYSKLTFHGGGQFEITRKMTLLPNLVFLFQGKQREYNVGTSLRFALGNSRIDNQSWQVGLWWRSSTKDTGGLHNDAVIVSTRFNYQHFGIGFSYDATISEFSAGGTANGAFEFSLSYDICGPEKRAVYCPRF